MSDHTKSNTSYDDLFDEGTYQEFMPMVTDIAHLREAVSVPETVNWQNLKTVHMQQITRQKSLLRPAYSSVKQLWWRPLTQKAVMFPSIALLLFVISAFTLVMTPLLQNIITKHSENPAVSPVKYSTLGAINLTQKIGKTTVILEKGYIDNNQLVLEVVATPIGNGINFIPSKLTEQSGQSFKFGGGMGVVKGQTLVQSFYFDNTGIVGKPATLNLTFTVTLMQRNMHTPSHIFFTAAGTMTFNVTLPYDQNEIVAPNLKVTSHGKTLTLANVSIGKTDTQISFSGPLNLAPPVDQKIPSDFLPTPKSTLKVAGIAQSFDYDSVRPPVSGLAVFHFDHDFSSNHGPWTITITQGTDIWVFHFDA